MMMTLSRGQRFALGRTGGSFRLRPVSVVGSVESFVWSVVPVSTPRSVVVVATARAEAFRVSTGRVPSVEIVEGWVSDVV